jgi:Tfp pilus assembly protein PilE
METMLTVAILFLLAYLIYSTFKHIQRRAREDDEHSKQVKQRPTLNHTAYERSDKRYNKQVRDSKRRDRRD